MTPRGVVGRAGGITRPGATRRPGGLALTALILIIVYLAVRLTGGAPNPLVHFAYLAIGVAGVTLGPLGGALSGLAAGLLLGPLMPDHTAASATILGHWGWLVRLGAYVAAGLLVAAVARSAGRAAGVEAARQQAREILNLAASEPTSLVACRRLLVELARRRSTLAAAIYILRARQRLPAGRLGRAGHPPRPWRAADGRRCRAAAAAGQRCATPLPARPGGAAARRPRCDPVARWSQRARDPARPRRRAGGRPVCGG